MKTILTIACGLFLVILTLTGLEACKPEPPITPVVSHYPAEVSSIFVTKCATAGCHNAATKAGGIRMDEWKYLFEGGVNGAVVIPYRPDLSSLMYFINTNPANGPVAEPTMPYNQTPLSQNEYEVIKNWILAGAPDEEGNIPFSSDANTRQKMYVTQQACDEVAVIDMASKVVMRSISVGTLPSIENPHALRTDEQGQYAYVALSGGSVLQKIDMQTDKIVGEANIGQGKWSAFALSENGDKAAVADWQGNGSIAIVNTTSMSLIARYESNIFTTLSLPHGIAGNKSFDTFFITRQTGNSILKLAPAVGYQKVLSLDGLVPQTSVSTLDPHEIIFSPDYSRYFVSCERSNDVRVMDARADTLIQVIPTAAKPQEFAMATSLPYLFVSCMEATGSGPLSKGAIYVINYNTLQVVAILTQKLYQPHGLAIDEQRKLLLVVNRNFDETGPAPHHSSSCAGRNGFYQFFDINTLQPIDGGRKYEVLPDPYAADVRFH